MRPGAARFERIDLVPAVVIAAGVALALVPFAVRVSPPVLVAIWIASVAARSIAPVHQHCHAHLPVFDHRIADAVYDVVLMLAAGNITPVWELQHVKGHHRSYLGRVWDPANNLRFGGGRARFTILGDAMSIVDSVRLAGRGERVRLACHVAIQICAAVALVFADPRLALAFFGVPWLLLRWAVFWFSYAQHDRVPMTNVYTGSVTHFGWTNRLYLNVGHHTAHHEKPTLHWTQLPARTRHILERIPPACLR